MSLPTIKKTIEMVELSNGKGEGLKKKGYAVFIDSEAYSVFLSIAEAYAEGRLIEPMGKEAR